MQMIATAKISKIKQVILVANRYEENANNFFDLYLKNSKFAEKLTEFTDERPVRKVLILFLASDKGTCGAINTTINKTLINVVKNYQKDNVSISIAPIGKKAFQFIQKETGKLDFKLFIDSQITAENYVAEDISVLIDKVIESYRNEDFDKIEVVAHDFKNIITCNAVEKTILPLKLEEGSTQNQKQEEIVNIIENQQMIDAMIKMKIKALFDKMYVSNLASIVSSRMNAMDNATKNGNEIIAELKILYNKSRQARITNELIDIVSGSEAIS